MAKARNQFVYTLLGYVAILAILLLIALAIGASVYYSGIDPARVSQDAFAKWGGLTGNTALMFGWVVKRYRRYWRSGVFWATLGTLLVLHIACFWIIFLNFEHWRLAWFIPMYFIEPPLIGIVLDWSKNKFGKEHHTATEPRL